MSKITERIARTSNIPPDRLTDRPPLPKSVKIEVTDRCDLKCYFCEHTYDRRKRGEIEGKFLFRLLDELNDHGVEEVGLFWMGEPLLVDALPEYIYHAKKIGIRFVFITSNGRSATPERIRRLIDSGLDSIKFSINAPTREKYLKICGVDAFERVLDNLKAFWSCRGDQKKPGIYASSVYDPAKAEEYEEIHSIISPYVDEHYPLVLYGKRRIDEKSEDLKVIRPSEETLRKIQSKLPCWSLFTIPHISYAGHMSACYCDPDQRLYMADLNKTSFAEAWHSEEFVRLRGHHLRKDVRGSVCEQCVAYR